MGNNSVLRMLQPLAPQIANPGSPVTKTNKYAVPTPNAQDVVMVVMISQVPLVYLEYVPLQRSRTMPPSGDSQFILDLLAKSVAKVNSQGGKREIHKEVFKASPTVGTNNWKPSENEHTKNVKKALNVNVKAKVNNEPEVRSNCYSRKPEVRSNCYSEDIIKSVVYNHLTKVSPKLAEKFSNKFAFSWSSLVVESVVECSYQELIAIGSTKVGNNCTGRKILRKTNLRKTAKRFSLLEDEVIKAALSKGLKIDFLALSVQLKRNCDVLRKRAELLERTGGVIKKVNFTLIEDKTLIERVVLPKLKSEKLSEIVFRDYEIRPLIKELNKSKGGIRSRWNQTLQPWLLQHYSGTLNLRVERMLANHIADTYTDFTQIDWRKVTARKEFVGHTYNSLRGLYFNQLRDATKKKLQLASEDVDLHHIVEYCELVYGEEAQG